VHSSKDLLTINQPHIPDFARPLALLAHCHERIEGQLRALERAAEILDKGDVPMLALAFAAADAAVAHFATPGVKHTEDEEISLFPRLRERGGAGGAEVLAAVREMEAQHRTAERVHADFESLVARMARDGSAEAVHVGLFQELVVATAALYRPHIRAENELVFPVAARVLPAVELQALGAEMRARRRFLLQSKIPILPTPPPEV
jgi:hemerythrin-like domain-containing protein